MSLSNENNSITYEPSISTSVFDFPYPYFATSDIKVRHEDSAGNVSDVSSTLFEIEPTNGSLESGCSVTFDDPYTSGDKVTIYRDVPYTQEFELQAGASIPPTALNVALDRTVAQSQQIIERQNRSLSHPITDDAGLTYEAPSVTDRANKLTGWDASGNVVAKDTVASVTDMDDALVLADGSSEPRDLSERFADVVNVLDFGATGLGGADDSGAFIAAEATGSHILVPNGTYKLDSNVTTTDSSWELQPNVVFTGTGTFDQERGLFIDTGDGANIYRVRDRLLLGDAVDYDGLFTSPDYSWLGQQDGVDLQPGLGWIEKNSTFASYASVGAIGVTGAARTFEKTSGAAIGLIGVGYNDNEVNQVNAWGLYIDSKRTSSALGTTWGIELAMCNHGTYVDAYDAGADQTYGISMAAGAGTSINGTTDSLTTGIQFISNGADWGRGIVFNPGSLRLFTDHYKAITMRNAMQLGWEDSSGNSLGHIRSTITSNLAEVSVELDDSWAYIRGYENAKIIGFGHTVNGVNYLRVINNATTGSPKIYADGDDTNIGIQLVTKGTGTVKIIGDLQLDKTKASITTETLTDFIQIRQDDGSVVKLAVVS